MGNAPIIKAKVAGNVVTLTIKRGDRFSGLMANVFVSRTATDAVGYLVSTNKSTVTDQATFPAGVQFVTYTYQVQMMNGSTPEGNASEPLIVVIKKPL